MKNKQLMELIKNKEAHIGVIGLGHAGLPCAILLANQGYKVTGFDIDRTKVDMLNKGKSYLDDVSNEELAKLLKTKRFQAKDSMATLGSTDVKLISVPTLLTNQEEPDLSAVEEVSKKIAKYLSKPSLVLVESTVYPGATEAIVKKQLDDNGFKLGKDYFLAYSPSRIDPGNKEWHLKKVPKLVGGVSSDCLDLATALYKDVVAEVIQTSSIKIAETTKLFENSFRAINIAFVDRFRAVCQALDMNIWEIIELAKTKPYGFTPFYPGPGVGGDCIPIDPLYVAWKVKEHGMRANFIELAQRIIDAMPRQIVGRLYDLLNENGKSIKNSKILLIGAAFKKDNSSTKNSPIKPIIKLLSQRKAIVSFYDPYVDNLNVDGFKMKSAALNARTLKNQDAVLIITDHSNIDYGLIAKESKLVYDTRNALAEFSKPHIHR